MDKTVDAVVIGAGIGGISAAAHLARTGASVAVYERLPTEGGRAQVWRKDGYRFDMGPSWYWMPEVHDQWFSTLGYNRADYYGLTRLSPSYRAVFSSGTYDVPSDLAQLRELFNTLERGAGARLDDYLERCRQRYEYSMKTFIYRNFDSILDIADPSVIRHIGLVKPWRSYHGEVRRYFRSSEIHRILEYPVVFLGSSPQKTPAVYTLMNWIDFGLGSWYPDGGFGNVLAGMRAVAESLGVRFYFNSECTAIEVANGKATGVEICSVPGGKALGRVGCRGGVIANADYHFVEQTLLAPRYRSYSGRYWGRRRLSPSVVNFYLGLDTVIPDLQHHTFFFDSDWDGHFASVYRHKRHIRDPLFYIHAPGCTDPGAAPVGGSALFVLIPIAAGIQDSLDIRGGYFDAVCRRIQGHTGCDIRKHIVVERSYSISDFERDYNAYRGNAFGLGHTLLQTASFRPRNYSTRVDGLYYCGHFTTPGTGTTMSMLSGELAVQRLLLAPRERRTIH